MYLTVPAPWSEGLRRTARAKRKRKEKEREKGRKGEIRRRGGSLPKEGRREKKEEGRLKEKYCTSTVLVHCFYVGGPATTTAKGTVH